MTKFLNRAALAATVATGLFAAPALAAPADTETFTAKAVIVKPVTMTNLTDLDFGSTTMNPTLTSATVSVSSAGGVAVCSSAMLTCSGGSRADFTLSGGVAGQTISVSYSSPPAVLTHTNGTNTVGFSLAPTANVLLDSSGAGVFAIGGQITVVAATVDGAYSADVDVVANYL